MPLARLLAIAALFLLPSSLAWSQVPPGVGPGLSGTFIAGHCISNNVNGQIPTLVDSGAACGGGGGGGVTSITAGCGLSGGTITTTGIIANSGQTAHGNSAYNILATDRTVITNAAFTAPRIWTLPAANAVSAGCRITITDVGNISATNTLTVAAGAGDTVVGGNPVLAAANQSIEVESDGVHTWSIPTSFAIQSYAAVPHQFLISLGTNAQFTGAGIGLTDLPSLSANTVLGALTATTPSGLAMPSCSGGTNALIWTSGTGFGCNTISGGSGTVTNVATNATLTGGPITTTGTLGINLANANTWTAVQTFSASSAPIISSDTSSGAFISAGQFLAPNLTSTQQVFLQLGVASATNNSASFGFTYAGSGSTSNEFDVNFYGGSTLFKITAAGAVSIPGTTITSGDAVCYTTSFTDCGAAPATIGTGLSLSGTTLNSNAVEHISYQPGLLTAVNSTKSAFHKFSKAATVDNIEGSASSFTCTGNPTITLYECGTSTTCTGPTTIGSATVTAAGTVVDGTVSSASITAGDYVAWAISAGTCASIDIVGTAQVHSN